MDNKECRKCGEVKPLEEYHKHKRMADGHLHACKVCVRLYNKLNARRRHRTDAEYREKCRVSRRLGNMSDESAGRRKESVKRSSIKREMAEKQATPSWANRQLIASYYKEAKRLEELTGIKFHVDHIIPLQGDLVSGLHVESNLQLLPEYENLSKSNRFDPQIFCA